mmetsp:Transcript_21464/g.33393  ORF Transcript_21464/g.33393 Transcript_21464/m.33393 type:complete len:811 (+) Transcript_21464:122-2554(+)
MALVPASSSDDDDNQNFLGMLVEIVDMTEPVPASTSGESSFGVETIDVNGHKGRAISWKQDARKYGVATFSGFLVYVAEENLQEYEPGEPEDGGFDLLWPQGSSMAIGIFGSMMADCVETNGYCVMQMFLGDEGCHQVGQWATVVPGYHVMTEDMQEHYLGREAESKSAWLGTGTLTMMGMDDVLHDTSNSDVSALELCDQIFTDVANYLYPYTQQFSEDSFPFQCWGRTNTMIRASFESDEEKESLCAGKHAMLEDVVIEEHYNFMDMKKLCMMYLIDSEGGTLTLHADQGDVEIPLTPNQNQLVVFRDGQMEYTYSPVGKHVALQAWIIDEPMRLQLKEEDMRIITGPEEPPGERVNIMSLAGRYPGKAMDGDDLWAMFVAGSDNQIKIPQVRWDVDIYYREEHTIGFSMTCHGGFMQDSEMEKFNNTMFNLKEETVRMMSPKDRLVLEVGYEALKRGGYREDTLRGLPMGVYLGDSGTEWVGEYIGGVVRPDSWDYHLNAISASRLSWTFGMVGPVVTAETACSSSLVGMGMCHMSMRSPSEEQSKTGFESGKACKQNLVAGINTMVGVGAYISLSGPGMLTHKGRCFTFDVAADGYARGEGVGAMVLKKCQNSIDSMGRLAMIIGTCVNQDGRSASMTAPHGPSQQEVIRACMVEAGLDASMVTIAECHGTGTALGDPIEIGSLRGTMKAGRGEKALLTTSAKASCGHLEAGAGMLGVIKCVLMLRGSVGCPNCHLRSFNPHLDLEGFPIVLENEPMDFQQNSGLTGVSSFGFGGTNARADLWGNCTQGPRASVTGTSMRPRSFYA